MSTSTPHYVFMTWCLFKLSYMEFGNQFHTLVGVHITRIYYLILCSLPELEIWLDA